MPKKPRQSESVRDLLRRFREDPGALTPAEFREAERLARKVLKAGQPDDAAEKYAKRKVREAKRQRQLTKAGQDIGPLPDVADPARRAAAEEGLKVWCETYLSTIFTQPWSRDHLRVLDLVEHVIEHHGLFAIAMPRGSGKTSISRAGCLWGLLTGRCKYVVLVAATDRLARKNLLRSIKTLLVAPGPLVDDYPEACHPFVALDGETRRCGGQRLNGELTHIGLNQEEIVLATVPGAASSGGIIQAYGLTGSLRGPVHVRPDGTSVRPDVVICDDPQTRESARSAIQTAERLELIQADVCGMGGPQDPVGVIVPCTVTERSDLADQLLDRRVHPEWRGERMKMLYAMPRATKLWDEYARIRTESLDRHADIREATAFYQEHQTAMDAGARVAWSERFDPDELSAIQHAMNLKLTDEQAFASEYQNEPLVPESEIGLLRPADVAERVNGRKRGQVSLDASAVTAGIDLHKGVIYWVVAAWAPDFTGAVIDYGTYPKQATARFSQADAKRTLGRKHQGMGENGAIQAGLLALAEMLLGKSWRRGGGGVVRIDKVLCDAGYKPRIVEAVRHRVGGATLEACKGIGLTAARKPFSAYRKKRGERYGQHWYYPAVKGTREFRHVLIDTNYWKTWVHEALQVASGDPGALTLFGQQALDHLPFAEHVAGSETWTVTTGQGREVHEWRQRPQRPDNHWFDCLVYATVAASVMGCAAPGMEPVRRRRRRKYRAADLRAKA